MPKPRAHSLGLTLDLQVAGEMKILDPQLLSPRVAPKVGFAVTWPLSCGCAVLKITCCYHLG